MDYRDTLNLPRFPVPLEADVSVMESRMLEFWEKGNIYEKMIKSHKNRSSFYLHDGPPYSNDVINGVHAFNKILKDMVIKFKNLRGIYAPFIPGWDTHGLPNEIRAIKNSNIDRKKIDTGQLRNKCRESALYYVQIQKEEFQRLGVLGDWQHAYETLDPFYESRVIEIFAHLVREGMIYREKLPVNWCSYCETTLADMELEYKKRNSPEIFVKLELIESRNIFPEMDLPVYLLVWTRTPWTLTGGTGVALNPQEDYCLLKTGSIALVMSPGLVEKVASLCVFEDFEKILCFPGKSLEFQKVAHPFLEKDLMIIMGSFVNTRQGSGCVLISPGLGREDFQEALKYNLPVAEPVDHRGILNTQAGIFEGLHFTSADHSIVEHLLTTGAIAGYNRTFFSYPHCGYCHNPIIYRSTHQWFIALDIQNLRSRVMERVENNVRWIPPWGEDRMINMLKGRPDWCISRQRLWGIPIPVFFCRDCGEGILDSPLISGVAERFRKEGSDCWFIRPAEDFLPKNYKCPYCGSPRIEKMKEIFDVWFESGASHYSAYQNNLFPHYFPADLYMEAHNQYRGWFQTSLILSVALEDIPPFRTLITHGWVSSEEEVSSLIKKFGADLLRLFFSSVPPSRDINLSEESLKGMKKVYQKIRNTLRFLVGNLYDFDPVKNSIKEEKLTLVDRHILHLKSLVKKRCMDEYDKYNFHLVYKYLYDFMNKDLSSFYFNGVKPRLFSSPPDSLPRRSCQTVFFILLRDLLVLLSPILSFTCEELWQSYTPLGRISPSVFLSALKEEPEVYVRDEFFMEIVRDLRSEVNREIENLRKAGTVRDSRETLLHIFSDDRLYKHFIRYREILKEVFMTAGVEIELKREVERNGDSVDSRLYPGLAFRIGKFHGAECPRCKQYFSPHPPEVEERPFYRYPEGGKEGGAGKSLPHEKNTPKYLLFCPACERRMKNIKKDQSP